MKNTILTLLACLALAGCASSKHSTEQAVQRDSTIIVTHHVTDTMFLTLHDTIHEETQRTDRSQAYIILQDGTYDTHTGVIHGVSSIQLQADVNETMQRNQALILEMQRNVSEKDSMMAHMQERMRHYEEDKQPPKGNAWHTFTNWYFFLTILVLLAYLSMRTWVKK